MENKYGIVGVAHVGLPTNDLQKTVEFYKSLGFEVIMQSYNETVSRAPYFSLTLIITFIVVSRLSSIYWYAFR